MRSDAQAAEHKEKCYLHRLSSLLRGPTCSTPSDKGLGIYEEDSLFNWLKCGSSFTQILLT